MSEHLAAALTLAAAGHPVFPCVPSGKSPLTRHGYLDATTDASLIRTWWSRWPAANIGSPTGQPNRYDVVDIDVRPSGDGWFAFRRARRAGLLDGWIRAVRTPSGGLHLYFPGTDQRNGSIPRAHIDFRGVGGYVLVPPSRTVVSGRPAAYRVFWRNAGVARAVSWNALKDLLDQRPTAAKPSNNPVGSGAEVMIDRLQNWLRTQPEGNRNAALFWAACRAAELDIRDLGPLITAAVASGLPTKEAAATVASAYRRHKVSPAGDGQTITRSI